MKMYEKYMKRITATSLTCNKTHAIKQGGLYMYIYAKMSVQIKLSSRKTNIHIFVYMYIYVYWSLVQEWFDSIFTHCMELQAED